MPGPSTRRDEARGAAGAEVLDRRALNRALLARQMLLRRADLSALEAVERLVGLQAQAPDSPYLALWTRLAGFDAEDLSRMVGEREVVRIALMRSTIHLVSARDALMLRPLVQPVQERALRGSFGKRLEGIDLRELAGAGRVMVEEEPRTFDAIGKRLAERWPGRDPLALSNAVRALLPLVQVPPRGMWGHSGRAAHTTTDAWLGRPLDADSSLDEMVMRYLAAFGPASVGDVQAWSGLTRLAEVVDRLRPRLRVFRDERGRELFDLPDAPRPDGDTPAPARFLPDYDNVVLSHADRTRIVSDEHRGRVIAYNARIVGTILLDGFVAGTWRIARERDTATLLVEPFAPPSAGDRAALEDEGARLLAFAADDYANRDIQLVASA